MKNGTEGDDEKHFPLNYPNSDGKKRERERKGGIKRNKKVGGLTWPFCGTVSTKTKGRLCIAKNKEEFFSFLSFFLFFLYRETERRKKEKRLMEKKGGDVIKREEVSSVPKELPLRSTFRQSFSILSRSRRLRRANNQSSRQFFCYLFSFNHITC